MGKLNEMAARFLVGGIGAIVTSLCIIFAENEYFRLPFTILVGAIGAIALWEYYGLVKKKRIETARFVGIGFAFLYFISIFFQTKGYAEYMPEIFLGLALFSFFVYFAFRYNTPIASISSNFLGLIYIALPFGLLLKIVYFYLWKEGRDPYFMGSYWLAFLIIITKGTDIGAFFIGRQFGKTKLAPWISPGKTIAGALGGIGSAVFLAIVAYYFAPFFGIHSPFWAFILLGILLAIGGQLGDLAESLLKRDAGVKDSNVIAGMGGILDMVDSLLFTAPILYIFLLISYNIAQSVNH